MSISATRKRFASGLREFAWNEWSQMGVASTANRLSSWTQDPESLLVFTFEVAREDPRLFDEVLDWLVVNERLISVRRLRALCATPEDERLVDAALAWVSSQRPRARLAARGSTANGDQVALFPGRMRADPESVDEAFAAQGFLRPRVRRSSNSQPPDLRRPINFAFRLRQLLGVGARAEVVRLLLTIDAPRVTAQVVARSAGYAKRNVYEALNDLHRAGVLAQTIVSGEQWFAIDRERWATFLDGAGANLPRQRDWPHLLSAAVRVLRWLDRPDLDELSEYLRGSQAFDLLEEIGPDLRYAGVQAPVPADASTALDDLARTTELLLRELGVT